MKKPNCLFIWQAVGVLFIVVIAILWHYLYDVIPSPIIGMVAPVNESPWEHAKLFFAPALIFYIIEYLFIGKKYPNFITAHTVALVFMPIFMLLVYYSYAWMFENGENLTLNIINTVVTITVAQLIAYRLTKSNINLKRYNGLSIFIVHLMFIIFAVFTFHPPKLPLFYDPINKSYGIRGFFYCL